MYAYRNDRKEVDIEITEAFDGVDKVWNVVPGCTPHENLSYPYTMTGTHSSHRFTWLPTGPNCEGTIDFSSWHGHGTDPAAETVFEIPIGAAPSPEGGWRYSGGNTPCESDNLRPNLSLWVCSESWCTGDGSISEGEGNEIEVVISDYAGSQEAVGAVESASFFVAQDAMTRGGSFSDTNYGGLTGGISQETLMGAGKNTSPFTEVENAPIRSLLEFPDVQAGVEVESAILSLKTVTFYGSFQDPIVVDVAPLSGPWDSGTVDWNDTPSVHSDYVVSTCLARSEFSQGINLEILPIARAWFDGTHCCPTNFSREGKCSLRAVGIWRGGPVVQ